MRQTIHACDVCLTTLDAFAPIEIRFREGKDSAAWTDVDLCSQACLRHYVDQMQEALGGV